MIKVLAVFQGFFTHKKLLNNCIVEKNWRAADRKIFGIFSKGSRMHQESTKRPLEIKLIPRKFEYLALKGLLKSNE
jgi:hypothetical protein